MADLLRRFGRRLRWAMVGGGTDSIIGETHRLAARLDGRYDLVAGCLSVDPEIARESAALTLIAPERAYTDYRDMAAAEAARDDGVEVVTICTPPDLHAPIARLFLEHGIDVICEKPMTATAAEARDLAQAVAASDGLFVLTHCYTGYPMVRQARAMVAAGEIGDVRLVESDFVNGAFLIEEPDPARKHWRFRPEVAGVGSMLGEIGSHAHNIACFVTGRPVTEVSASLKTYVQGRATYDDAQLLWRLDGGIQGRCWQSFVAAGNEPGLAFRIYGTRGGLSWHQEDPEGLWHRTPDAPARRLTRGRDDVSPAAERASRIRQGHPEGYFAAFANLYRDFADALMARALGEDPAPHLAELPTAADGVATIALIEATLASHDAGGVWTPVPQA